MFRNRFFAARQFLARFFGATTVVEEPQVPSGGVSVYTPRVVRGRARVIAAAAVCSGRVRVIQPVHAAGWFEPAAPVLIALGTARVPVDLVDEDELLLVGLL